MEHSEAIEMMAAERYALGEMTPEERDRFEEHYFDCSECSQSVRDGVSIAAGTRAAGTRQQMAPRNRWWAVAAAAFVAVIGYQNAVTIPHLRGEAAPAARITHPVSLMMAETRGDVVAPVVVGREEVVSLYFDVPPETPFSSYVAEVRDADGKVRASLPVTANDARQTVTVLIRPGVLTPGTYEIAVSGIESNRKTVVAQYPFEVRFR
jgi:hypothetical protein